jgi:pteridine reductase
MKTTNKVVLITGSSDRIGKEIAKRLISLNYKVAIHYNTNKEGALKLAKQLGDNSIALQGDLNNLDSLNNLVNRVIEHYGRWDILINNASVFEKASIEDIDEKRWDLDHNVHYKGPFFLSKALYEHLKVNGREGAIINISDSQRAPVASSYLSYHLAKGSLREQSSILAKAFSPYVRVNQVEPGPVLPLDDSHTSYFEKLKSSLPFNRLATLDDLVDTILFLLENNSVTGAAIAVDAGGHLL